VVFALRSLRDCARFHALVTLRCRCCTLPYVYTLHACRCCYAARLPCLLVAFVAVMVLRYVVCPCCRVTLFDSFARLLVYMPLRVATAALHARFAYTACDYTAAYVYGVVSPRSRCLIVTRLPLPSRPTAAGRSRCAHRYVCVTLLVTPQLRFVYVVPFFTLRLRVYGGIAVTYAPCRLPLLPWSMRCLCRYAVVAFVARYVARYGCLPHVCYLIVTLCCSVRCYRFVTSVVPLCLRCYVAVPFTTPGHCYRYAIVDFDRCIYDRFTIALPRSTLR